MRSCSIKAKAPVDCLYHLLDDDKQKYNYYSKNANIFGLLQTRHIKKNLFGVNLHTAATLLRVSLRVLCINGYWKH